ncbi:MAG TPA: glutamine synthetase family protein [Acidimicrobiales bacterium]|jgi:glutamine synthetase|nr:glutamine synthetase family protein [Acidimicrobiales bacterium]
MQSQREYVLRTVEERGVRFVQLWFTDVLGVPKSFSITPAELENALDEGMTFDGSAIDGFSRVQESDVLAKPDPKTFQILPLKANRHGSEHSDVARVFCDILNLDGSPFEGCPRHVLRRNLERARGRGFSFYAAPEIEYFYFADGSPTGTPKPLDSGSYFELTVADLTSDLRKRTVLTLEDMGIPVEYAQHEDAPSQHEIDLRYTDALTMADTVMTVRLVVKEIAQEQGVYASFMPKPLSGVQGSGMHTHFSLFEGDKNAFNDPGDGHGLSALARQFIAGLLHHAHEITAVTNQWVNSYKRLVAGYEAPVNVSWAYNNRSALVRVPIAKRGRSESTRIEFRSPDPACNPYLAFAVVLAAGLRGIEEKYELGAEASSNLFSLTPEELASEGIRPLPTSLHDALVEMERSELVAEALGEHVFEWFLRNKRAEWEAYTREVTPFEIARYLPQL